MTTNSITAPVHYWIIGLKFSIISGTHTKVAPKYLYNVNEIILSVIDRS